MNQSNPCEKITMLSNAVEQCKFFIMKLHIKMYSSLPKWVRRHSKVQLIAFSIHLNYIIHFNLMVNNMKLSVEKHYIQFTRKYIISLHFKSKLLFHKRNSKHKTDKLMGQSLDVVLKTLTAPQIIGHFACICFCKGGQIQIKVLHWWSAVGLAL